jgi:superfamily II DNA/RNA helicase
MTSKLFSELGLSPALLKAIHRLGYEKAAPIQSEAIPLIMSGSDVVGQSQTGSGKTAAFGIPAVELVDPHLQAVQVIILCPTRELAVQVAEEIFKLSRNSGLEFLVATDVAARGIDVDNIEVVFNYDLPFHLLWTCQPGSRGSASRGRCPRPDFGLA